MYHGDQRVTPAPLAQRPTTLTIRVFWKCTAKGCRATRVTDLEAMNGKPVIRSADDQVFGIHDWMFAPAGSRDAWQAYGLLCDQHGAYMRGNVLNATYNPAKVCDARCMNARRASCDCSCRGANHGGSHAVSPRTSEPTPFPAPCQPE